MTMRRLTDGEREVLAELEADARPTLADLTADEQAEYEAWLDSVDEQNKQEAEAERQYCARAAEHECGDREPW